MRPEDVAPEYLRCAREHDADGIARLFAEDAVRISFKGEVSDGHAAVLDWYVNRDFKQNYVWHMPDGSVHVPPPVGSPTVGTLTPSLPAIVDGNHVVIDIGVELNDGSRHRAIDLFTLDEDGRVSRLLVYHGPAL